MRYDCTKPKYCCRVELPFPTIMDLGGQAVDHLVKASMAKNTWRKHFSGWNSLSSFESYSRTSCDWPLSLANWSNYITWALTVKNLKPDTVKSYIGSIKLAHTLRGVPCLNPLKEELIKLMLTGAENLRLSGSRGVIPTRRACTLPLLKLLGHRIAGQAWPEGSKQTVWAALTTGFFASVRLGEILAEQDWAFDPMGTLLWENVMFKPNGSILIHIRQPKVGKLQGDFLDLFPFVESGCCPVASLKRLKNLQIQGGQFKENLPVFAFPSGCLLTPSKLNTTLKMLLADLCTLGGNTISCHSFRAAIPTALAPCSPNPTSDTMCWGRWSSGSYRRYVRPNTAVKKDIFDRIKISMS